MKTLNERFNHLDKIYFRTVTPNGYFSRADIMTEVKGWLEDWKKETEESVRAPLLIDEKLDLLNDMLASLNQKPTKELQE